MFSAGSDIFETKFKDHELEDESARASECWEASCGTEFGCRFFDRLAGPETSDFQHAHSVGFVFHAEYNKTSLGIVEHPSTQLRAIILAEASATLAGEGCEGIKTLLTQQVAAVHPKA